MQWCGRTCCTRWRSRRHALPRSTSKWDPHALQYSRGTPRTHMRSGTRTAPVHARARDGGYRQGRVHTGCVSLADATTHARKHAQPFKAAPSHAHAIACTCACIGTQTHTHTRAHPRTRAKADWRTLLHWRADTHARTHARAHTRMHTHAHGHVAWLRTLHAFIAMQRQQRPKAIAVRLGSAQDCESHRLLFQSGLKRLEKIGEEGAAAEPSVSPAVPTGEQSLP